MPFSRSAASPSDRLFYRPDIRFSVPHLPLRLVLFWPANLTPRSPFSGTPGPSFHSPFWYPWSSFSTPSFFPPNLPFPVIWVAGSLFVPPYGWPAVFTAPRFLPPRGFYRSAVFSAPRFLPLRFHRFFGGLCSSTALVLDDPQSSPTSGRLALWATLRYACDFYRSAVFTAPRFLPLRGFYRSAVFTAPRFLPLRGFLPLREFLPLRFRRFFGGLYSSFLPPQSSPSSGRTLCYRLLRSVSGGTPFLIFFLYHLLNRSRSVTAHLTGFPFVHFIHIRGSSVVSSFEWRDTGTTCTTTSLMGPFGYRKLGNLTYHRLL